MDWTASSRKDEFEFVRVRAGQEAELIETVTGGSIDEDLNTALKSSGSLSTVGDFDIGDDKLRIYLVSTSNGETVRVPLGTFFATTPTRNVDPAVSTSKVDLSSVLLQLDEDAVEATYVIPAGTVAVERAKALVEGSGLEVVSTPSTSATTADSSFEAGTSVLEIVNYLLDYAGYSSAFTDGYGRVVMAPYRNPSERVPVWTFRDDDRSILLPGTTDQFEWYHTPNVCIATMSNLDEAMTAIATNDDPQSPYSTVSRGRRIVRTENYSDIETQEALQAKADALLVSSSSNVQKVSIKHNYAPFAVGDVIRLDYQAKGIDYTLTVQSKQTDLVPGVPVTTSARRFIRG